MLDSNDLVVAIKKAAIEAVGAMKPTELVFGKVISSSPLKINIEQKLTLSSQQIVLSRNVTDFKTKINGTIMTINNALKTGEEVILLRMQGGQKYMVIDRVVMG